MRRMLFLLLLFPVSLSAQIKEAGTFWKWAGDSSSRPVSLPDLRYSDLHKVYEVGKKSSYFYIVDHDSVYYRIFSRFAKDSLPVFDFSKQELIVNIACVYCSGGGNLNGTPRHRNACGYADFWFLRDKKKF